MFQMRLDAFSVLSRVVSIWIALFITATAASAAVPGAAHGTAKAPNNRNWVAMHIFDSIYPIEEDGTFADSLSTMETTIQQFTKRQFFRTVEQKLHLKTDSFGDRNNEGHYLMWLHFSDDFIAKHPNMNQSVQPFMYMYPDHRQTDVFTAWGGNINVEALLTQGVSGLGVPTTGNYANFLNDVVTLGDADYEGGWYMTDDQAERILTSFNTYPGVKDGYSFLRSVAVKPNAPYEPPAAQLVNGYNCGDFVMYALRTAGVLTHDVEESLKIKFWYPEVYYANPLPLKGVGAKGAQWLNNNPGQTALPQSTMLGYAWPTLLFSNRGMEFFDKKTIASNIQEFWYPLNYARVWDQAHVIAWVKTNNEFRSKGILTELLPAVLSGAHITSPDRTVTPTPRNTYTLSNSYKRMMKSGDGMIRRKLKDAHVYGVEGDAFRELYQGLKTYYPTGATGGSSAQVGRN